MPEVTISINSRQFQILCKAGEEGQLAVLADDLAMRVASIKQNTGTIGDSHLLVLAGLMLINELADAHHAANAAKQEAEKAEAATKQTREDLNGQINELEDTVAQALNKAAAGVEKLLEQAGDNPEDTPPVQ